MAGIFGRPIAEARERVGSLDQFAGIDSLVDEQGAARGSRRVRVSTGGGLQYDVLPDRALDLGAATFDGIPLAWLSPAGFADPRFAEPEGLGWLRTFGGGLLATCGLDSYGPPQDDEAGVAPMHGRIGTIPATMTRAEATPDGLQIAGRVRQTRVFGENLVLSRSITSAVGGTTITIDDTVTNEGAKASPHMVLYHVNVGWPLLDDGVTIDIPADRVTARDADAAAGFDTRYVIEPPVAGYREQVFVHEGAGFARVTNERQGIRFTLRFSNETLPALLQWKMTDVGHFVLGLEPTNTPAPQGRASARASGHLPILEPGEGVGYQLVFEFERI